MTNPSIYILAAVSAKIKTDSDIVIDYAISTIKYGSNESFEEYKNRVSKYEIESFTAAYLNSMGEAIEFAEKNPGDINEGGCNNYLVIYSRPIKYIYPETAEPEVVLLKYTPKGDEYVIIEEDNYEDIHKSIISRFNIFYRLA